MKNCFVASFCCFLFSISLVAKTYRSSANQSLLQELDRLIDRKEILHRQKEERLSQLKHRLRLTPTPEVQLRYQDTLYHEYLHYQADSAFVYWQRKQTLFEEHSESLPKEESHTLVISHAEVLGVMGLYDDALHLLRSVRPKQLDSSNLCYYYRTCRACYGWMAEYTTDSKMKKSYQASAQLYRDSILTVIPDGWERECVWAEKNRMEGNVDIAIDRLAEVASKAEDDGSVGFIYLHYTLAELYEIRGEFEQQIYHLALTAQADMKASIREYASLPMLAQRMYEEGDVRRAYKYLSCSLEDAVDCNARLRSIEVSQIYPIIEKNYKIEQQKDRRVLWILLVCMCLLSVLLLVASFFLYRWMKKLSKTRHDLSKAYKELKFANDELAQTGRIKEAYIARYLDQCVVYLDKLDAYRRSLVKLAMSSRVDELYKAVKSEDFIASERKEFYHDFDKSFLNLFPHFVESFNELLQEEARIQPKSGEMLTTELRIFALIRLGIIDSNRIAHFLRYSLTTIYNYRSKLRNKALDKENFEQQVMNL